MYFWGVVFIVYAIYLYFSVNAWRFCIRDVKMRIIDPEISLVAIALTASFPTSMLTLSEWLKSG